MVLLGFLHTFGAYGLTMESEFQSLARMPVMTIQKSARTIALGIIVAGLISGATAQTQVSGGNVSGTWTASGSPYLVQGSIMVPNDSTLQIQPGVQVIFQGHFKFLVLGTLLAEGTATDSISFISADPTIGWQGVRFDQTPVTNDSSRIHYCNIQWGYANGPGNASYGGGIYFGSFSKVTVSNSRVSGNRAVKGGALYMDNSNPSVLSSEISDNQADYGGGIYCSLSNPVIANNSIHHNVTNIGGGGAIVCVQSSPIIEFNYIQSNIAEYGGGAIYCASGPSAPLIDHNVISYNQAMSNNAGAVYLDGGAEATLTHNMITYNTAEAYAGGVMCSSVGPSTEIAFNQITNNTASMGGGMACITEVEAFIHDNLIANNASMNGGAMYIKFGSSPLIENNTIVNNHADGHGGGFFVSVASEPVLHNCIVYGNEAAGDGAQLFLEDEDSDPDLRFCDLMGGIAAIGLNNNFYTGTTEALIDEDPLFTLPAAGAGDAFDGSTADWTLVDGSPCMDAGDPDGVYPAFDLVGNPRISGMGIDLGAYESNGTTEVREHEESGLIVYPNPTHGIIQLDLRQVNGPRTVQVLDVRGRMLFKAVDGKGGIMLDLSGYGRGQYCVVVVSGNGDVLEKLVMVQ